jgi:hypothetical protein
MDTSYERGDTTRISLEVRDHAGAAATPSTLQLTIRKPDATQTTYTAPNAAIVEDALGVYHSDVALTQEGVWAYQWATTGPDQVEGGHINVRPAPLDSPTPPWRPTVADIAVLLRARTNSAGSEVGTFNDSTRPTGSQVEQLVTMAVEDVASRIDVPIPARYVDRARRLAALQTATLVEASYFPNELETDSSAFRQYQAMFLTGVEALRKALRVPLLPA